TKGRAMHYEISQHPVPPELARTAHIDRQRYETMYRASIAQPEQFWSEQARQFLHWEQPFAQVREFDFHSGHAAWFRGGKLNAAVNCLDRHLATRADQVAFIWEADEPSQHKTITYREAHVAVCRLANVLRQRGVRKGDRVCIYMPMIPEAAYAMLACARIGAVHSVVFGGFSPEALKDRILDSDCRVLITTDRKSDV